MGLLSIFKDKDDASASPDPAAGEVLAARARARRRLIGATLLLAVGVLGFPLLFETQPRPVPVDIPIEIPRKENAPPLVLPPKRTGPTAAPAPVEAQPAEATAETATTTAPKVESAAPREATPVSAGASGPMVAAETRPASQAAGPLAGASKPSAQSLDAQRAQALLDGRAVAPAKPSEPASARVVVQVGAYTDAEKLRDVRQRVEQLGMKTYTQVVEAEGTRRTRVRVGPFGTRQDAESAAARIKAAGLPAAILVL